MIPKLHIYVAFLVSFLCTLGQTYSFDSDLASRLLARSYAEELYDFYDLYRRKNVDDPFDGIDLHHDANGGDPVWVPSGNALWKMPAFGGYTASGRPTGPVNQEQFIDKTSALSQQVKNDWDNAPGYQKINYEKPKRGPNTVNGLPVMQPMLDKDGMPQPKRGPMSTGQLTGTGNDLQYDFQSQHRPSSPPRFDANGQALLDQSQINQARKNDPNFDANANALAQKQADINKANGEINRQSTILKDSNSSPADKAKAQQEMKELQEQRKQDTKAAKDLEGKNQAALNLAAHKNGQKCPECKLVADKADKPDKLPGAWQQAYGWRPNVNGEEFGPQEACDGENKKHGCKQVQKDNGITDTFPTAQALEAHKKDPNGVKKPEEASLCKRGSPNCEYNPKKPGSQQTTPVSVPGKEDKPTSNTPKRPSNQPSTPVQAPSRPVKPAGQDKPTTQDKPVQQEQPAQTPSHRPQSQSEPASKTPQVSSHQQPSSHTDTTVETHKTPKAPTKPSSEDRPTRQPQSKPPSTHSQPSSSNSRSPRRKHARSLRVYDDLDLFFAAYA